MDRWENGVPGTLADTRSLSGRTPDCTMIDESDLRPVNWRELTPASPAGRRYTIPTPAVPRRLRIRSIPGA